MSWWLVHSRSQWTKGLANHGIWCKLWKKLILLLLFYLFYIFLIFKKHFSKTTKQPTKAIATMLSTVWAAVTSADAAFVGVTRRRRMNYEKCDFPSIFSINENCKNDNTTVGFFSIDWIQMMIYVLFMYNYTICFIC